MMFLQAGSTCLIWRSLVLIFLFFLTKLQLCSRYYASELYSFLMFSPRSWILDSRLGWPDGLLLRPWPIFLFRRLIKSKWNLWSPSRPRSSSCCSNNYSLPSMVAKSCNSFFWVSHLVPPKPRIIELRSLNASRCTLIFSSSCWDRWLLYSNTSYMDNSLLCMTWSKASNFILILDWRETRNCLSRIGCTRESSSVCARHISLIDSHIFSFVKFL